VTDLVNISIPTAGITALLGYAVVFFGLVLLMLVLMAMGKVMYREPRKAPEPEAAPPEPPKPAPGSAGELNLYDTDPRDAAMIMAIVADTLGKPINELRFISIREVKEDEV
jgi:Na+-transporting methylmalonyl-CoA/oxaloacetate decarboxylase gamma subunit